MRLRSLLTCLLFAALGAAAEARAQTAPTTTAAASAALPLKLELGSSKLDPESVRKAVELELKRPVVLTDTVPATGAPSLSVVAHADHTVTVSYQASTGVTRTRSIGVPEDNARGAEIIALLSGNLSRDEAAELLAELAAKADAPATATTPIDGSEGSARDPTPKADAAPKPSAVATRPASAAHAQPSTPPPLIKTPPPAINLSLVAPTALYRDSERRIFAAEFGLGYSHVGQLHGAGFNLCVLRSERDVEGVSWGTFYNYTGGMVTGASGSLIVNRRRRLRGFAFGGIVNLGSADAQGFSLAGLTNLEQDFEGFQAAGLVNGAGTFRGGQATALVNWGNRFEGAQTAGLVNWANGFQGAQVAGLVNRAGGFEGLQTAGVANWANESQGLQLAGALNRARAFTGMQAAGAVNIADAITGFQLGVVNVAGDVQGLQLGVVNVAKHVDGTSIGLVSIAENGRIQPVLWASSSLPLNAAVKFTVGPVYTQAGLGYGPGNQTYTYELGLGLHFRIGRFFLEPGAHYSEMRSTKQPFDHELIEYGHYRLAAGLDLGPISPFAGGGVLQRFAHSADAPASVPVSAEIFGGAAFF